MVKGCPRTQAWQRSKHTMHETWTGGSPRVLGKRRTDENRMMTLLVWLRVVDPGLHYVSALPLAAGLGPAMAMESLVSRRRMTGSRVVTCWTVSHMLRLW